MNMTINTYLQYLLLLSFISFVLWIPSCFAFIVQNHRIASSLQSSTLYRPRTAAILHLSSSSIPPTYKASNQHFDVSIEYCTGCRWLLRSMWMAQELLTTFENEITSITLIPSKPPSPGGIFTVTLNGQLLWDRKVDGGFPESKQIKQKVRDVIAPDKSLGHSDVTKQPITISTTELIVNLNTTSKTTLGDCIECNTREDSASSSSSTTITNNILQSGMTRTRPNLCITYPNRNYMFRSAWLAQEILTSMQEEMGSVTLVPTRINVDEMTLIYNGTVMLKWNNLSSQGFYELLDVKERLNDCLSGKERGDEHVDEEDEDAQQMRRLFGVA